MAKPNIPAGPLNPRRILCLFDYKCNTGFSTVSTNIVKELVNAFGSNIDLSIFATNYFGPLVDDRPNVHVCSAQNSDPVNNEFGWIGFLNQLNNVDFDGVFIIQDLTAVTASKYGGSLVDGLYLKKNAKRQNGKKNFKSIYYFPVDCSMLPVHVKGLEFFDLSVAYTEYGKKEVLKLLPALKGKLKVVPHGNNSGDFYPIHDEHFAEIANFRNEYFGEEIPNSRFIISNINRNQPRKDIPNTVFAFMEAKENWPFYEQCKPFLYLHLNPQDPQGWDMELFMAQTGLIENEDYMICPDLIKEQGASLKLMNLIYNASDLYLTTTTGEGWGLTVTEAMATKTPVICPNHTSLTEITGNGQRAWLLETLYPCCSPQGGSMIRKQTDFYEVADKIIEVATEAINNTAEYRNKIQSAYQYTQSLDWKEVCQHWVDYFHETFDIPYRS